MDFDAFKSGQEVTALFLTKLLSDPTKTMQEIRSALDSLDTEHLNQSKLGDLPGIHTRIQHKEPFVKPPKVRQPTIQEAALAYLKQDGGDVSVHDLAEIVGSSAPYITRVLKEGFDTGTLPIMPTYHPQERGLPMVCFRYLPGVAAALNKEVSS